MSGLILRRLRGNGADRGAVAVIVAILFGGAVLLGMGAFVVDAGDMYAERAQLQNGADSGALAVASGCAQSAAGCSNALSALNSACSTTPSASSGIASCNANDNTAKVDSVCGSGPGLNPCPSPAPASCPSTTPSGSYVQVQTSTLNPDGTTLLPPTFGKAVLGSSWQGEHVQACAQASWAPPGSLGAAVAVTISYCEWQHDTANGTTFGSYPPWPPSYLRVYAATASAAGSETVLRLHGDSGTPSCNSGNDSAGWDAPGAFGWVGTGSTCTVSITSNSYPDKAGNSAINACAQVFLNAYNNHRPIYIPVYRGTTGTGSGVQYTLQGFAAFIVTGWDFTSGNSGWSQTGAPVKEPSEIALSEGASTNQANYCHKPLVGSNSDTCLFGFFTQALIPASALPGGGTGSNLGGTAVQLVG